MRNFKTRSSTVRGLCEIFTNSHLQFSEDAQIFRNSEETTKDRESRQCENDRLHVKFIDLWMDNNNELKASEFSRQSV